MADFELDVDLVLKTEKLLSELSAAKGLFADFRKTASKSLSSLKFDTSSLAQAQLETKAFIAQFREMALSGDYTKKALKAVGLEFTNLTKARQVFDANNNKIKIFDTSEFANIRKEIIAITGLMRGIPKLNPEKFLRLNINNSKQFETNRTDIQGYKQQQQIRVNGRFFSSKDQLPLDKDDVAFPSRIRHKITQASSKKVIERQKAEAEVDAILKSFDATSAQAKIDAQVKQNNQQRIRDTLSDKNLNKNVGSDHLTEAKIKADQKALINERYKQEEIARNKRVIENQKTEDALAAKGQLKGETLVNKGNAEISSRKRKNLVKENNAFEVNLNRDAAHYSKEEQIKNDSIAKQYFERKQQRLAEVKESLKNEKQDVIAEGKARVLENKGRAEIAKLKRTNSLNSWNTSNKSILGNITHYTKEAEALDQEKRNQRLDDIAAAKEMQQNRIKTRVSGVSGAVKSGGNKGQAIQDYQKILDTENVTLTQQLNIKERIASLEGQIARANGKGLNASKASAESLEAISKIKQDQSRGTISAAQAATAYKNLIAKKEVPLTQAQERMLNERVANIEGKKVRGGKASQSLIPGFNFTDAFNFLAFSQLSSATTHLAKGMVDAAASIEQYKRRIDIVVKNPAKADKYFNFLLNYEKITPYELPEVMQAGVAFAGQEKSLKRVGETKESAVKLAGELGSINPQAGIVEAQRALSRVIAGDSNGLEILRSQFNVNNETLAEGGVKLSASGVPLQSLAQKKRVIEAINKYVEGLTGGVGAESQSTTLQGKLSTLGSQVFKTMAKVMEPLIPAMTVFVKMLTQLFEIVEKLPEPIRAAIGALVLGMSGLVSIATVASLGAWGKSALGIKGLGSAATGLAGAGATLIEGEGGVAAASAAGALAPGILGSISKWLGGLFKGISANLFGTGMAALGTTVYAETNFSKAKPGLLGFIANFFKAFASRLQVFLIGLLSTPGVIALGTLALGAGAYQVYKKNKESNDNSAKSAQASQKYATFKQNHGKYTKEADDYLAYTDFAALSKYGTGEAETRTKNKNGDTLSVTKKDTSTLEYKMAEKKLNWAINMYTSQIEELTGIFGEDHAITKATMYKKIDAQEKLAVLHKKIYIDLEQMDKDLQAMSHNVSIGKDTSASEEALNTQQLQNLKQGREYSKKNIKDVLSNEDFSAYSKNKEELASLRQANVGRTPDKTVAERMSSLDDKIKDAEATANLKIEENADKITKEIQDREKRAYEYYSAFVGRTQKRAANKLSAKEALGKAGFQDRIDSAVANASPMRRDTEEHSLEKDAAESEIVARNRDKEADFNKRRIDEIRQLKGEELARYKEIDVAEQAALTQVQGNTAQENLVRRLADTERVRLRTETLRRIYDMEREHVQTLSDITKADLGRKVDNLEVKKDILTGREETMTTIERLANLDKVHSVEKDILKTKKEQMNATIEEIKHKAQVEYNTEGRKLDPNSKDRITNAQEIINQKQKMADILAKRDSDIKDAQSGYGLEVTKVKDKQKREGDKALIEAQKSQIDNQIALGTEAQARLKYNAAKDPDKQSRFTKIDNLKQQFQMEKAMLILKNKKETMDPTMDPVLKMVADKQLTTDILDLQTQYLEKVKAVTGELEKQNKIKELQKQLEDDKGFTLGGTYTLEELNKRDALDSELMKLKAGFGEGSQGQDHGFGGSKGQDHGIKAPIDSIRAQFGMEDDPLSYSRRNGAIYEDWFKDSNAESAGMKMRGNKLENLNPSNMPRLPILPVEITQKAGNKTVSKELFEVDLNYDAKNSNKPQGRKT